MTDSDGAVEVPSTPVAGTTGDYVDQGAPPRVNDLDHFARPDVLAALDDHARASNGTDVEEFLARRGLADPTGARIVTQRSPCPDGTFPVPITTPDGKTYWKCV